MINKDLRIGNEPGPLTPYPETCSKGPHFLNENDFITCYWNMCAQQWTNIGSTFTHCWPNVAPSSATPTQHWSNTSCLLASDWERHIVRTITPPILSKHENNIGSMHSVCWETGIKVGSGKTWIASQSESANQALFWLLLQNAKSATISGFYLLDRQI